MSSRSAPTSPCSNINPRDSLLSPIRGEQDGYGLPNSFSSPQGQSDHVSPALPSISPRPGDVKATSHRNGQNDEKMDAVQMLFPPLDPHQAEDSRRSPESAAPSTSEPAERACVAGVSPSPIAAFPVGGDLTLPYHVLPCALAPGFYLICGLSQGVCGGVNSLHNVPMLTPSADSAVHRGEASMLSPLATGTPPPTTHAQTQGRKRRNSPNTNCARCRVSHTGCVRLNDRQQACKRCANQGRSCHDCWGETFEQAVRYAARKKARVGETRCPKRDENNMQCIRDGAPHPGACSFHSPSNQGGPGSLNSINLA